MSWIPDASVAGKWHFDEDDSEKAKALLREDPDVLAPDFLLSEFLNVAGKKIRDGLTTPEHAEQAMDEIAMQVPRLIPARELFRPALRMSAELNHPAYDCLYLALADREGVRVVTDDRAFFHKVEKSQWRGSVVLLSDA